jgi:hypothetical protein
MTLNRNIHFFKIVKISNTSEECAASLFQFGFDMKYILGQSHFDSEQEGDRTFLQDEVVFTVYVWLDAQRTSQ